MTDFERVVDKALKYLPNKNIIIIYDRGLLDNCAYISKEDFQEVLKRLDKNYTISDFLDRFIFIQYLIISS